MSVVVQVRFEVTNAIRAAIAHRSGSHGALATYQQVRQNREGYGESIDDDMADEFYRCEPCQAWWNKERTKNG